MEQIQNTYNHERFQLQRALVRSLASHRRQEVGRGLVNGTAGHEALTQPLPLNLVLSTEGEIVRGQDGRKYRVHLNEQGSPQVLPIQEE